MVLPWFVAYFFEILIVYEGHVNDYEMGRISSYEREISSAKDSA